MTVREWLPPAHFESHEPNQAEPKARNFSVAPKNMPGMFYLHVPDADAVHGRALESGAESISPPTDQSYGDRTGSVTDIAGNAWYLATPLPK